MLKALLTFGLMVFLALSTACSARSPLYEAASASLMPRDADDFEAYLAATRRHLDEHLVALPGFPREQQVEWNMPFRNSVPADCSSEPSRGILLIHGLSDSPFVFRDFARALEKDCVQVRTVLLQGHGTRPGDLIHAEADVWRAQVRQHFNALAKDVDIPFIGGFSLGGALATELALSNQEPRPAGLVALAPAWDLNGLDDYLWLAGTANLFVDFLEEEPELNPVKYESLTVNAAVQLDDVLENVQRQLEERTPTNMPLFMIASEADSVIDLPFLIDSFNNRFTHPDNHLMIFRDQRGAWPYDTSPRITLMDGYRPDLNILEFSHQSLPAAPDNPLYGIGQPLQRCLEPNQMTLEACHALGPEALWYSAYSDKPKPVPTSRLTFNPDFDRVARALSKFILARDIP